MNANSPNQKPDDPLTPLGAILSGLFALESRCDPDGTGAAHDETQTQSKLQKAATQIAARPSEAEAAYLARELVQCTLPHRDPRDVTVWARRNGNFTLILQAGVDEETLQSRGLPFGEIPRLLLLWIITEAVRTKSKRIRLSHSLNDFLRSIGSDPNTGRGKRGDAKRVKEQLLRLLDCHISFRYNEGDATKGKRAKVGMEIAPKNTLWWDFKNPGQNGLFESELILGEEFFTAVTASPVPMDFRVVIALKQSLKQSAFAIDIYTWATYRLFTMQRAGVKQIKIPLSELKEQFGSEYTRLDHFKAALVETLKKVHEVFPALDYHFEKNLFVLCDSRQNPSIAPTDKRAAQRRLAEQTFFDQVSAKARERFKTEFPQWDVETVISDFYLWREEKGQVSANTDAHFRAFAKTWVQRNR